MVALTEVPRGVADMVAAAAVAAGPTSAKAATPFTIELSLPLAAVVKAAGTTVEAAAPAAVALVAPGTTLTAVAAAVVGEAELNITEA